MNERRDGEIGCCVACECMVTHADAVVVALAAVVVAAVAVAAVVIL